MTSKNVIEIKIKARTTLIKDWQERWDKDPKGRWTHRLIQNIEEWTSRQHGTMDSKYIPKFQRAESPICEVCHDEDNDALHTIYKCKG